MVIRNSLCKCTIPVSRLPYVGSQPGAVVEGRCLHNSQVRVIRALFRRRHPLGDCAVTPARLGCPVQSATSGRMGAGLSPSDTTGATGSAYTYLASLL